MPTVILGFSGDVGQVRGKARIMALFLRTGHPVVFFYWAERYTLAISKWPHDNQF
jgi:hypothetical protein